LGDARQIRSSSFSPIGRGATGNLTAAEGPHAVDTFGGKVFVDWDRDASVIAYGPVAYLIEFLKTNGLWQGWVEDCPLQYTSPNAPPKQDKGRLPELLPAK
jgi:hypothetical protein